MPDVARKKVVILGDSLSDGHATPGGRLAYKLRAAGADVQVNAKSGRSVWNFYKSGDTAGQLATIRAFDPDLVIVVLGTNDIGLSVSADLPRWKQLRAELGADGAGVWAFGPPTFPSTGRGSDLSSGSAQVMTMMHTVFGDRLLDLRPLTADLVPAGKNGRSIDGVHFTAAGGQIVGDRMAKKFLAAETGFGPGTVILFALGWLFLSRR